MIAKSRRVGGIPALLWGGTSDKVFIFVHGKHSTKAEAERFAGAVVPQGYQVLSFDLPEHGERQGEDYPCTVQNGVADLKKILASVKETHQRISLFACSLGAYFSLLAYRDIEFENCLFLSPVLDMEKLIENMMRWAGVDEDRLRNEGEVETAFGETLSWDYLQFVRNHRITTWDSKTSILCGENDHLMDKDVLGAFEKTFSCDVLVMPGGEHFFSTPEQLQFVDDWIADQVLVQVG